MRKEKAPAGAKPRKKPIKPFRFSNTTTFTENASYPCLSSETPKATRITAQKNSASPVGHKHDRDIPSPKHTVHMHRHW